MATSVARVAARSRFDFYLGYRRSCSKVLAASSSAFHRCYHGAAAAANASCDTSWIAARGLPSLAGASSPSQHRGELSAAGAQVRRKHGSHKKQRDKDTKHSGGGGGSRSGASPPAETRHAAMEVAARGEEGFGDDDADALVEGAEVTLESIADVGQLRKRFGRVLGGLEAELRSLRGGRVEAGMLDHVLVDAYGSHLPLSEVAQVSVKGPSLLAVTVFDPPLAAAVATAIRDCGMNLNPIAEGTRVSVPVPKPSQEAREALAKVAANATERAKVHLRGIRHKAMERLKKHKDAFSSDDVHRREKEIDAATAAAVEEAGKFLEAKRKSIML